MDEYSNFELPFDYSDEDKYIRAIRFNLIRPNGDIKISAFKSNKGGLSVTRSNEKYLEYALNYMRVHFEGMMAIFPTIVCKINGIYEKHSPSEGHNLHHWELYGDETESALTSTQIMAIIKECLFV